MNVDSESLCVDLFIAFLFASLGESLPGLGLASCNKPGRTPVLLRRLTLLRWAACRFHCLWYVQADLLLYSVAGLWGIASLVL